MELNNLTPYELEDLIEEAETILQDKRNSTITHHDLIEKDSTMDTCPHCGSKQIIKHGHHNGAQRFLCKQCKHTFGSTQSTLFYWSKISYEKWMQFIQCELLHLTLAQSADICHISKTTCFYMRHKLYDAVSKIEETKQLSGNTEVDALFMNINLKGTRP